MGVAKSQTWLSDFHFTSQWKQNEPAQWAPGHDGRWKLERRERWLIPGGPCPDSHLLIEDSGKGVEMPLVNNKGLSYPFHLCLFITGISTHFPESWFMLGFDRKQNSVKQFILQTNKQTNEGVVFHSGWGHGFWSKRQLVCDLLGIWLWIIHLSSLIWSLIISMDPNTNFIRLSEGLSLRKSLEYIIQTMIDIIHG